MEGFRLDAIQKRNPQIQTKDLLGRLPREHRVRKASDDTLTVVPRTSGPGLTNVAMRWRWQAGILSWSRRANSDGTRKFLEQFLTADQLRRNTTRGSIDLTKQELAELYEYKKDFNRAQEQKAEIPEPPRRIPHMAAAPRIPRHRRPNTASTSHADFQTAQSQQVDRQGLNPRSYGSGLSLTHPFGPSGNVLPSNHCRPNQPKNDQLGGAGSSNFLDDGSFLDNGSSSPLDIVNLGTNNRRKRRHAEVITPDDDESSPFQLQKPSPYHEDVHTRGPAPKKSRLDADSLPKSSPEKSHRHFPAPKSNSREGSKREGVRAGPAFSRPKKSGSRPSDNGVSSNPANRADHDSGLHQLRQGAQTSGCQIEVPTGFGAVFFPVGAGTTFFATTDTEAYFGFVKSNNETKWESMPLSVVIEYLQDKDPQQDDEPGVLHTTQGFQIGPDQSPLDVPYRISSREGYGVKMFPVGALVFYYSTKDRTAFAGRISPQDSTVWSKMSWEVTIRTLQKMEKRWLGSLQDGSTPHGSERHSAVAPIELSEEKVDGTTPDTPSTSFHYPDFHAPTAETTPQEQNPPVLSRDELMLLWDRVDAANSQVVHTKQPESGGHFPPSRNHADAHINPQPIISGRIYEHGDNSHGQAGRHGAEMPTNLETSPSMAHHEIGEYSAEQVAQIEREYFANTYGLGAPTAYETFAPPALDIPETHIHEVDHVESADYTHGSQSLSRSTLLLEDLVKYNMARGLPPLPI